MNHESTINEHINNPDVSVNQYIRSKCLELGKVISLKKSVYLDTKFWLILRDVALDRNNDSVHRDFYEKVFKAVESGRCVFPISEDVFLEVVKQTDQITLSKTLWLIDFLSLGVSMISFEERIVLEVKHFILSSRGRSVHDCGELVWTKLAYNMGFFSFSSDCLDAETDKAFQKSFIDYMWLISLSDFFEAGAENNDFYKSGMPKISGKLNEGKFKHLHENKSFKQMFLSELGGALDVYSEMIADCVADLYEAETGQVMTDEERKCSDSSRLLSNAILNAFKLNRSKEIFPTLNVTSGLHAAIRWDRNQKYQDNDLHDIRHAASALPYCDAFFTEKRLAHLITQKVTGYDKKFYCVVASSVSGASEVLSNLKV